MRDELLPYYERELGYMRRMGAEFAAAYPKVASRLALEPTRCEDPYVERLLEAFSLLSARIHLKLNDDLPEITQSFLNVVYPHFLRPVPSMSIAEFRTDPRATRLTEPLHIPRGSLLNAPPSGGLSCQFRTCFDTTAWPLRVAKAQWRTPDRLEQPLRAQNAVAALSMELECLPGASFQELRPESFRLFLNGESAVVFALHELLSNNCAEVVLRDPQARIVRPPLALPKGALQDIGFDPEHAMLPYPSRSFQGYRLLQEYAAMPEKFLFLDLHYMEALQYLGATERVEIVFLISSFEHSERQHLLEDGVHADTIRLGCSPIVNLFEHTAEPILLDPAHYEFPVVPDTRYRSGYEVFSIEAVSGAGYLDPEVWEYQPAFSFRHGGDRARGRFYQESRRQSINGANGPQEVFLSFVNLTTGNPVAPDPETLTVRCFCTNGDLPSRLPFANEQGDLSLGHASPVSSIVCLRKHTPTFRPALKGAALWKLISHLSLNYLSLVEDGRDALCEMLKLYQSAPGIYLDQQIEGIHSIRSSRHTARVSADQGIAFVRGLRVDMELDEDKFVGGSAYLFASVLERFLSEYVSMNSFVQLAVRTRQRKDFLKQWPPRVGNQILL